MNADPVTIHLLRPSSPGDLSVLTDEEKSRAAGFRFADDSARWISYRSSLRRILGATLETAPQDVPILLSDSGKPLLGTPFEHVHFSLSHVDALALLAVSHGGPVGIDVESKPRAVELLGCETSFCHPDELEALPTAEDARAGKLLELWTMKEAVLKALGTGFLTPPESVKIVTLDSICHQAVGDESIEELKCQCIQPVSHPALSGYQAALSSRQRAWKLIDSMESTNPGESARIRTSDG